LIRKVYMPMEILVVAAITVKAIEFCLQMLLAVTLLMILHHGTGTHDKLVPDKATRGKAIVSEITKDGKLAPGVEVKHIIPEAAAKFMDKPPHFAPLKAIIVVPSAIILSYLFVLGLSMPLAAWCVIYKDLDHIIAIVMRVLFYGTPVFWAITQVEGKWVRWNWLNPVADLLTLFRAPMYWGTWPFNEALGGGPVQAWGVCILFTVIVLVGGYALFGRSKNILSEVV